MDREEIRERTRFQDPELQAYNAVNFILHGTAPHARTSTLIPPGAVFTPTWQLD